MEIEHVHFPPYRQLYIDLKIFSSCLVKVKEKGFFLPQDVTFFLYINKHNLHHCFWWKSAEYRIVCTFYEEKCNLQYSVRMLLLIFFSKV